MNERLLEIAAEAGIDTKAWRTYPGGFPREDYLAMKQFAQLIITDAIKIVEPDSYHQAYPDNVIGSYGGLELLYDKVAKIKRHFGV